MRARATPYRLPILLLLAFDPARLRTDPGRPDPDRGDPTAAVRVELRPGARASFRARSTTGAFSGTTRDLRMRDDGTRLVFTAKVADVDTGIRLRNRHLRERYVDARRHPQVELVVSREAIRLPEAGRPAEGTATGTFRLRGVAREVTIRYRLTPIPEGYRVRASFRFDVRDFGIRTPRFLIARVDPRMRADATFEVTLDRSARNGGESPDGTTPPGPTLRNGVPRRCTARVEWPTVRPRSAPGTTAR